MHQRHAVDIRNGRGTLDAIQKAFEYRDRQLRHVDHAHRVTKYCHWNAVNQRRAILRQGLSAIRTGRTHAITERRTQ